MFKINLPNFEKRGMYHLIKLAKPLKYRRYDYWASSP